MVLPQNLASKSLMPLNTYSRGMFYNIFAILPQLQTNKLNPILFTLFKQIEEQKQRATNRYNSGY